MARQRQTVLITLGALILGVLVVGFVASQQLASTPSPSLAVVVASPSPAQAGAVPTRTAEPASPQSSAGALSLAAGSPTPSGIALYQPAPANSTPASIPTAGRTLGDAKATVTIDLYGDFRCSACFQFTEGGTAAAINDQLIATAKAKLVWHDFTVIDLVDKTGASRDAANAAWCAADQNKFWVMHDWLYLNQSPTEAPDAFTTDRLLAIGQVAGLDMASFTPCVRNGTHNAAIAAQQASLPAAVAGHGTPSVLVNGTFVDATFDSVRAAVAAAN